jgi:hypothetical protein
MRIITAEIHNVHAVGVTNLQQDPAHVATIANRNRLTIMRMETLFAHVASVIRVHTTTVAQTVLVVTAALVMEIVISKVS